jgi:hypothetical protein
MPPLDPDWVLFAASCVGAVELAIEALDDGADPDFCIQDRGECCKTIAAERGHASIVALFRVVKKAVKRGTRWR